MNSSSLLVVILRRPEHSRIVYVLRCSGVVVVQFLDYSPPTYPNRIRFPDFPIAGQCSWLPESPVTPVPLISVLLHTHLFSPSSAQISSLSHSHYSQQITQSDRKSRVRTMCSWCARLAGRRMTYCRRYTDAPTASNRSNFSVHAACSKCNGIRLYVFLSDVKAERATQGAPLSSTVVVSASWSEMCVVDCRGRMLTALPHPSWPACDPYNPPANPGVRPRSDVSYRGDPSSSASSHGHGIEFPPHIPRISNDFIGKRPQGEVLSLGFMLYTQLNSIDSDNGEQQRGGFSRSAPTSSTVFILLLRHSHHLALRQPPYMAPGNDDAHDLMGQTPDVGHVGVAVGRARFRKSWRCCQVEAISFQGRAAVPERLIYSPPTKENWAQSPAGSLPFYARGNRAGRFRWSAGFLEALPLPPVPSFRRCSILTSITLIVSQELPVKSRSNLFTSLHYRNDKWYFQKQPTSYLGVPDSIPGRVASGFCMWETCRTMPLVSVFSRGSPVSSPLRSGAAPHSPRFTLTSSHELDAKSHPNLFTHSL
ncbi:hypothetical protein PR048_008490 [Dryococelus australis]|uniref:Uncharacterized protein n=1 Tax=Dryococelus australis TaxID=614101 RepID=A0ABQ9HY20_9NEOP|nr:hypothetical protein PR048_008490 [Dryococelus australis]